MIKELWDWMEVGADLKEASPTRFAEILSKLKETAEAARTVAAHDHKLILRAKRPTKKYSA